MILYVRIVPGFWVAVEERTRPDLRTRPLVIGGLPQQRGLVREANIPAQRCGIRAGMTCAQAFQHCPDSAFLLPDLPRYEAAWEEIRTTLSSFTPLVQPLEMGHAVCDLSGCERRWDDIWQVACEVVRCIARCDVTPWVGVASNRLVAELASATAGADGITVVEAGQECAFLAELPLTSLPDVDPRLALTFQVLGLKTIGQLAALPASAVRQRFGSAGETLHRYARGIDRRPVVPPPDRVSIRACYDCEDGSIEEVTGAIHRLADTCAAELRQRHLAGRLISLSLTPLTPVSPSPSGREGGTNVAANVALRLEDDQGIVSNSSTSATSSPHSQAPPTTALLPLPRVPSGCRGRGLGGEGGEGGEGAEFPVPYRIHSMLPQPGKSELVLTDAPRNGPATEGLRYSNVPAATRGSEYSNSPAITGSQLTRTPLDAAPVIAERAQRLLLALWPREGDERRGAIETITLEISEFQEPIQLSFAELDRIDQMGALRGMDPVRLQALSQQEQVLAARYGDASFRHLTHLDPASILTERRFRWGVGLPPIRDPRTSHGKRRRST